MNTISQINISTRKQKQDTFYKPNTNAPLLNATNKDTDSFKIVLVVNWKDAAAYQLAT